MNRCADCNKETLGYRCAECDARWTQSKLVYCKECDSMVQRRCFEGPYAEYQGMSLYSCGKIVPNTIQFMNTSQIELTGKDENVRGNPTHFTFPDDPEKEPRPGWGPFKFDWLMKPFKPFVEWHDRVTTINSTAQQIGITNKQIVEYTRKQLEILADKPKNGFQKRLAWVVGFFLAHVNRFFYEGDLR